MEYLQRLFFGGLIISFCCSVGAYLNLFMSKEEVVRLLGIKGELYYVRDGVINNYALDYPMPIPHDISKLNFTWQNRRNEPPDMYYTVSVTHNNPQALHPPRLSLSNQGHVPTKQAGFTVVLPCTGLVSAEVEVNIQLNVSMFSASNITVLNFKRRKFCLEDSIVHGADTSIINGYGDNIHSADPNNLINRYRDLTAAAKDAVITRSNNTNVLYIAIGCACALIFVIGVIVTIYYIRSRKHNDRLSEVSSSHGYSNHHPPFGRTEPSSALQTPSMNASYIRFSPVSDLKPVDLRTQITEIAIDRSRLTLAEVLQEGTFGKIYHGILLGDGSDMEIENDVFVKTVTEQASEAQVNLFVTESCMMLGLLHNNVQTITAICSESEKTPMAVFPYASHGNLKKFLQKCKVPSSDGTSNQVVRPMYADGYAEGAHNKLSTQELVHMATEIIRGVQYLHKKKIIHKDLATRNCIVDHNLHVKVTDKALARDLFPNDYHCLGDNENRPVKWLAIESLIDKRFSPASDVWSFGVLLWEMMTLGQQPYPDIDPFEMASYLREGYRLSQPINCPDELFAVMACCWALCPDDRPKFSQLHQCLQDFYAHLGRFI